VTLAAVRLWGRRIGAVSWDPAPALASFEYDAAFRESGIQLAPLQMPLDEKIYQFPSLPQAAFHGLPGMLADSLPDRYGNALIDAWLARQGRSPESFDPVERLCYVGTRAMGALEYQPSTGPDAPSGDVDVAALVELADAVLTQRAALNAELGHDPEAIRQILQVGTSAGGARAKAVVAWNPQTGVVRSGQAELPPGFSHWLLKFDGVRLPDDREVGASSGYGLLEYAYSRLAASAGIHMSECRLLEEGGRQHFITRRFDRGERGEKLHLQSLAALGQLDFNAAGAHSYEQAIEIMRRLHLSQDEIEQQYRRAVFNVLARNQDDHVKNIAFLMDRAGEWSLGPAFDLTYSYNPAGAWTARHQMSLNGKREGFEAQDLLALGRFCNLKTAGARRIADEVALAVAGWLGVAESVGVPDEAANAIGHNHRLLRTRA